MNDLNQKKNKGKSKSIIMGPKKQIGLRESQKCAGRDVALLKSYIGQENITGYLASMLQQDGLLDYFNIDTQTSECISTFADSDYFAVSVKSADGEYFYDLQGQQIPKKVYFKLKQNPNTGALSIDQTTYTFDMPEEVVGKVPCIVNPETGKTCMKGKPPPSTKGRGRPPKTPSGGGAGPSGSDAGPSGSTMVIPVEELRAAVEKIQISGPPVSGTADKPVKLSREELDSMKDEEVLIEWMIKNVNPKDLLSCVRSGTLSAQESAELDDLETELAGAVRPSEQPPTITPEIAAAAQAVADRPARESVSILKRLSKEQLVSDLQALPAEQRTKAVVDLCVRFGFSPETRVNKRTGEIMLRDRQGESYSVQSALDYCAGREAVRLKFQLQKAEKFIAKGTLARRLRKSSQPPPPTITSPPSPQQPGTTKESVIAEINGLPDNPSRIARLTQLFSNDPGFSRVYANKAGNLMVEIDDDVEEWISALDILFRKPAFGRTKRRVCRKTRSVQNNFKCAAKKCKGTANYRLCMKKTLRSMYRKRCSRFGESGCGNVAYKTPMFGTKRRVCRKTRSVQNNFKCAAKKCKGTANYRKCMKTTLRSMYRKRCSRFGESGCGNAAYKTPMFGKTRKNTEVIKNFKCAAKKCKGTANYRLCMKKTLRSMYRKTKPRTTCKRKPIRRKIKRCSRNRFGMPPLTEEQRLAMIS
jgi:hypothetical protein